MKPGIKIAFFVWLAVAFTGCATYHVSTQSLLQQLANTEKQKKVTIMIAYPFFFPFVVTGNSLSEVRVLDKEEKEYVLPVTNHTGVRITKKDRTRKTFFYF